MSKDFLTATQINSRIGSGATGTSFLTYGTLKNNEDIDQDKLKKYFSDYSKVTQSDSHFIPDDYIVKKSNEDNGELDHDEIIEKGVEPFEGLVILDFNFSHNELRGPMYIDVDTYGYDYSDKDNKNFKLQSSCSLTISDTEPTPVSEPTTLMQRGIIVVRTYKRNDIKLFKNDWGYVLHSIYCPAKLDDTIEIEVRLHGGNMDSDTDIRSYGGIRFPTNWIMNDNNGYWATGGSLPGGSTSTLYTFRIRVNCNGSTDGVVYFGGNYGEQELLTLPLPSEAVQ